MRTQFIAQSIVVFALSSVQAHAEPVLFENSDSSFYLEAYVGDGTSIGVPLSITEGFSMQDYSGKAVLVNGLPMLYQYYSAPCCSSQDNYYSLGGGSGLEIAVADPIDLYSADWDSIRAFYGPEVFELGEPVDASAAFMSNNTLSTGPVLFLTNTQVPPYEFVDLSQPLIVGVRFELDSQTHYGFVELEQMMIGPATRLVPTRWGYESVPDTPIVIPAGACNEADLGLPMGVLNFFDVSEFLQRYTGEDSTVDYDDNGIFDFFDVSAFLAAYNAGCP